MQNAANNFEALTVKGSDGKEIDGSVLVTSKSDGFIAKIANDVNGDLTLKNNKDNGIILLKGYEYGILDVKGNVTLDMGDEFITGRAIWASRNINITSRNGGMFILNIDTEPVENSEILKATKNLTLKAAGNINISEKITAGNNITINSAGIDIFGVGSMTAGDNINLNISNGDIKVRKFYSSGGYVISTKGNMTMTATKGNIEISGSAIANKGNVAIRLKMATSI